MRIRTSWLVMAIVLTLVLIPTPARADGHRAGLFGGISFAEGSVLTGANISLDCTCLVKNNKHVGVMVDYSFHKGDGITRQVFMGGLNGSHRINNVVVSFHGLIGSVWGDGYDSKLAATFGGEVEYVAATRTLGGKKVEIAPMFRNDYGVRKGPAPTFWRVSTGLVLRWFK
jgi:hypothetical protein